MQKAIGRVLRVRKHHPVHTKGKCDLLSKTRSRRFPTEIFFRPESTSQKRNQDRRESPRKQQKRAHCSLERHQDSFFWMDLNLRSHGKCRVEHHSGLAEHTYTRRFQVVCVSVLAMNETFLTHMAFPLKSQGIMKSSAVLLVSSFNYLILALNTVALMTLTSL